jgi:hypothetical protein
VFGAVLDPEESTMRTGPTKHHWGVLLMVAALGCGSADESDMGVLVVPYELGNARDCAALGIVSVRAELDGGDYTQETDCEAGEVRFNLLEPGRYDVVVYGLDEDGVAVMDSLATGTDAIDVVGSRTTVIFDPAIQLTAAPAQLALRWEFGFSSCEAAAIERFGVSAWRSDGSELLMMTEVNCSLPGEGRDQYRIVPDADRELSGDELGEVEIQPYDVHDLPIGDAVVFGFDAPGPGRTVRLSLSCDIGGCEGSGVAD